jgi:hypothetical protein
MHKKPRKLQFLNTKTLFFGLLTLVLFVSSITSYTKVFANDQATTDASLEIKPLVLKPLVFDIDPGEIFVNQKLTFRLGPAISVSDQVLVNIPCRMWILPPNTNTYIVLQGLTNSGGFCIYQTDRSLQDQGLTLAQDTAGAGNVSQQFNINNPSVKGGNTNLASINQVLGNGFGFGAINYQATTLVSNNDIYVVSGGASSFDSSYENSFDGGSDQANSDTNNSGSRGTNTNDGGGEFSFLPRTGGEAISTTLIICAVVAVIFLVSRKRGGEEESPKK